MSPGLLQDDEKSATQNTSNSTGPRIPTVELPLSEKMVSPNIHVPTTYVLNTLKGNFRATSEVQTKLQGGKLTGTPTVINISKTFNGSFRANGTPTSGNKNQPSKKPSFTSCSIRSVSPATKTSSFFTSSLQHSSEALAKRQRKLDRYQIDVAKRIHRLQAIQAEKHTSNQLQQFLAKQHLYLQKSLSDAAAFSSSNSADLSSATSQVIKEDSSEQLSITPDKLNISLIKQLLPHKLSALIQKIYQENVIENSVPRLSDGSSIFASSGAEVDLTNFASQTIHDLRLLQKTCDSDATVSSSDEEAESLNAEPWNAKKNGPIFSTNAFSFEKRRSKAAMKCVWLQAQMSDVNHKIKQNADIFRSLLREKKAPFEFSNRDEGGCARTRPLTTSLRWRRKLIRLDKILSTELHPHNKKLTRDPIVPCQCSAISLTTKCVLCAGNNPIRDDFALDTVDAHPVLVTQPSEQSRLLRRISRLDHSYTIPSPSLISTSAPSSKHIVTAPSTTSRSEKRGSLPKKVRKKSLTTTLPPPKTPRTPTFKSKRRSSSSKPPIKQLPRPSVVELDSIVIPTAHFGSNRIEKPQYKEIATPSWSLDANWPAPCATHTKSSSSLPGVKIPRLEWTDDRSYMTRHANFEKEEKKKLEAFLGSTVKPRRSGRLLSSPPFDQEFTSSAVPNPGVATPTATGPVFATNVPSPAGVRRSISSFGPLLPEKRRGDDNFNGYERRKFPLNEFETAAMSRDPFLVKVMNGPLSKPPPLLQPHPPHDPSPTIIGDSV